MKNKGKYFHDTERAKDFSKVNKKEISVKEKLDKLDFIKIKSVCSSKRTVKETVKAEAEMFVIYI